MQFCLLVACNLEAVCSRSLHGYMHRAAPLVERAALLSGRDFTGPWTSKEAAQTYRCGRVNPFRKLSGVLKNQTGDLVKMVALFFRIWMSVI